MPLWACSRLTNFEFGCSQVVGAAVSLLTAGTTYEFKVQSKSGCREGVDLCCGIEATRWTSKHILSTFIYDVEWSYQRV